MSELASMGRPTAFDIDKVLGSHISSTVTLCTDFATNYMKFAQMKDLVHYRLNASKGIRVKKGIFHGQHANAYQSRLKKWMERFNGVATSYLNNYLYWFRFLELNKAMGKTQQRGTMLLEAFRKPVKRPSQRSKLPNVIEQ